MWCVLKLHLDPEDASALEGKSKRREMREAAAVRAVQAVQAVHYSGQCRHLEFGNAEAGEVRV